MGNSGKGIGIFALLIAIGALGFGVYQFILPSPSEGQKIYTDTNYNQFDLNIATISSVIPNLNVTYSANVGDNVLLEYSGNVFYGVSGGTPELNIYFYVDGVPPSPYAEMELQYPNTDRRCPVIFRYHFQESVAGSHLVTVSTAINLGSTGTYLINSVLKVTIY
ncbi:MAG: hypothetical protein ACW98X_17300 [Promethearchaeota archaeon]|jgi:hypothetical protein